MDNTNSLFHELFQTVRYLSKTINEQLNEHGLYHSQWTILYTLKRFGPLTQTELWGYLNVEAPTVTRTLAKLEKDGWVTRKPGRDKRERVVYLTEKAEKELPSAEQTIKEFDRTMLKGMAEEEQEQLLLLLEKIGMEKRKEEKNGNQQ